MAKNTGKVREFCQFGKVGTLSPCAFPDFGRKATICFNSKQRSTDSVHCLACIFS